MAPIERFLVVVIMMISSVGANYISSLSRCPSPCYSSSIGSSGWSYYHDFKIFRTCDQTVLFETNLYNPFNRTDSHVSFRACTAQVTTVMNPDPVQVVLRHNIAEDSRSPKRSAALDALSWGPVTSTVDAFTVASTLTDFRNFLAVNSNTSALFASHGDIVVGFYAGPGIDLTSISDAVTAFARAGGPFQTQRVVQWCGPPSGDANRQSFGLILDTNGDLSSVQSAMAHWAAGTCLEGSHDDNSWWSAGSVSISTTLTSSTSTVEGRGPVANRATCQYIQAQSGDGCWALTQRCGITETELESYNGGGSFCNNINIGQYVCCSSGSLPDLSPQPTDGNCYVYTVKAQDTCAAIAEAHQMKVSGIENNNNKTWGWMGCSDLQIGQRICLSTGRPPFPVNVPNAVCGPQVNGTIPTSDPLTWSDLNPCLLNACCDIWGQCGITSEFCTADTADTGAPGTAKPGSNGCISNCETDIKISEAPDSFVRVGHSSCSTTHTVTDCQVDCSITDFGTSVTTACYSTSCVTVEACSAKVLTTTSKTTTFNCPWTTALESAVWKPTDPSGLPPVLGAGGQFGYVYITPSGLSIPSPSPT
ncbi:hypothetical protein F5Y12DRAFT_767687 [Xylaria sp. FL1777]|nr:hypothetical protein F5Y12DRAFT_767687 [Xylaria sp. FL1777]